MNGKAPSIASVRQQLLERYPLRDSLYLQLGQFVIRCRSNSAELVAYLNHYFREFLTEPGKADIDIDAFEAPAFHIDPALLTVKQPDPGKTKIKEEYFDTKDGRIVRKRLTSMVFLFNERAHIAVGPCHENSNQVVNFINNRYIAWQLNRGALLGHASGIGLGDGGIAIAGFSGMGKSTLALHLMNREDTFFISNDRVMIRENRGRIEMVGIPKLPRINPGTLLNNPALQSVPPPEKYRAYQKLKGEALWNLEDKYDVDIADIYGPDKFVLKSRLKALIVLDWQRTATRFQWEAVPQERRGEPLMAFIKEPGLFFLPENGETAHGPDALPDYLARLRNVPVVVFSGGLSFDRGADFCLEILRTGHIPE